MATGYPEPTERWKTQLKSRIDENLKNLLDDAKESYEQKVAQIPLQDSFSRRKLYMEYLQTTDNLNAFAVDEYEYALERERQEMQWYAQVDVQSVSQQDEEDFKELETLKQQQFALLNAIQAETNIPSHPLPTESQETASYYPEPSTQHRTQPISPTQANIGLTSPSRPSETPAKNSCGTKPRRSPLLLSDSESESDVDHDSEDEGKTGQHHSSSLPRSSASQQPASQPDNPYALFTNFTPLSPLFESTSLEDDVSDLSDSESSQADSEYDERPSPPSTPPLSSASSQFALTPAKSIADEEAQLKAERQARQQEEFHRRAEEIRAKQRMKETGNQKLEEWVEAKDTPFYSSASSASSFSNPTSASTSAVSSSCPSPQLGEETLEPFVIAPISEEDLVRLFIFHDQQWDRISSFHSLQWSDFPWPVLNFIGPRSERELTLDSVSEYILSALQVQNADGHDDEARLRRKEMVKEQIRKWHPDRFEAKLLGKVPESRGERQRVRRGAGLVVKHLTELLGKVNSVRI